MKYLLDTHLLLWAASSSKQLSVKLRKILNENNNTLYFSVISLWEISIKAAQDRPDFRVSAEAMRRGLLENGYNELLVNGLHAVSAGDLPLLHRDPFDRMLITQAKVEGIILLTSDSQVTRYSGPIQRV